MTDNLLISKLKNDTQTCLLKKFRSSNSFLNQFLVRKAKAHQNKMIATTYLVSYEGKVVAFFSLLCDSLIMSKSLIEKCKTGKRYKTYPSIKIGRLAVDVEFEHMGIGGYILDYIKYKYANNQNVGARYLLVDALNEKVGFYLKNQFVIADVDDNTEDTQLMYYDLLGARED